MVALYLSSKKPTFLHCRHRFEQDQRLATKKLNIQTNFENFERFLKSKKIRTKQKWCALTFPTECIHPISIVFVVAVLHKMHTFSAADAIFFVSKYTIVT